MVDGELSAEGVGDRPVSVICGPMSQLGAMLIGVDERRTGGGMTERGPQSGIHLGSDMSINKPVTERQGFADGGRAGRAASDHEIRGGALNAYAAKSHAAAAKWWHDADGNRLDRNKGELIALMHSELSEMLEGIRRDTMDDHLPHRKSEEVELADLLIRAFDYAAAYGFDLDATVAEKLAYNAQRADHRHEARTAANGKRF